MFDAIFTRFIIVCDSSAAFHSLLYISFSIFAALFAACAIRKGERFSLASCIRFCDDDAHADRHKHRASLRWRAYPGVFREINRSLILPFHCTGACAGRFASRHQYASPRHASRRLTFRTHAWTSRRQPSDVKWQAVIRRRHEVLHGGSSSATAAWPLA